VPIEFSCDCGKTYRVDDRYAGRLVSCKACGRAMTVPAATAPDVQRDEYELAESEPSPREDGSSVAGRASNRTAPIDPSRLAPLQRTASTFASNPGQLYVETAQYLRSHWARIGVVAVVMVILSVVIALTGVLHGFWWMPPLVVPLVIWTQLSELKRKMANGDVCPAVVIHDQPLRVAVYTDLTNGGGSHPAVVVINARNLVHAPDGRPAVGDRLAAVSLYQGPPKNGAWQGFTPTLVPTVTRNTGDISRIMASIPDEQWAELEAAVRDLGDVGPGLHRLN
jgi:uncharacterized protein DUF3239